MADTVASGRDAYGVSELAENFGQDVYVDINGWHLFLRDMKFHVPLARIVSEQVAADNNRFEEDNIIDILKKCPVKVGGGRKEIPLYDMMPNRCVQDFLKITEEYVMDL